MKDKSAKDVAFEKERNKYRKQINELEKKLIDSDKEMHSLKNRVSELESELNSKDDWIERLLTYTEMSKEDIKAAVEKDKAITSTLNMLNIFSGKYMR